MDFSERYGFWAIIAGASEGTDREFARKVAAKGINLIPVARRQGPLEALAEEIAEESGVEYVTVPVDLTSPQALSRIAEAVAGREVGLYISNAGSDGNSAFILDRDIDDWMNLITLNVLSPL